MKVEIWSDVMCPFCFIGKHRFDNVMKGLPFNDEIEIEWKSFQLNPNLEPQEGVNMYELLSESKQLPMSQIKPMFDGVRQMGKTADIDFQFDKAIPANTEDAHRLIHFAQSQDKGSEMEERLFRALFLEGKNLNDLHELSQLAVEIGLDKSLVDNVLNSDKYKQEVKNDMNEAVQLGIQGVPFFVFDRKYAISGAQEENVFEETLNTSFREWLEKNPRQEFKVIEGNVCRIDGTCD